MANAQPASSGGRSSQPAASRPASADERAAVLARVPQQAPFRFIDEILELDDDHIVAAYTFREDLDFYRGHFPGNPLTPGVILVETMAQAAVVALGIHLVAREGKPEEVDRLVTVFTDANVEFTGAVLPGQRVITTGRKSFFRRRKLRADCEMRLEDGSVVCSGQLSGMGVPRPADADSANGEERA